MDEGKRLQMKKILAIVFVAVALVNLILMAMTIISPDVFMVTLLFLFLISFIYYKDDKR